MDIKYYVYVLENSRDDSWYIGYTTDVNRRMDEHNQSIGGEYTSKKKSKWKLIYFEGYINKFDAIKREKFLKSGSGRRFIKKQITYYLNQQLCNK